MDFHQISGWWLTRKGDLVSLIHSAYGCVTAMAECLNYGGFEKDDPPPTNFGLYLIFFFNILVLKKL